MIVRPLPFEEWDRLEGLPILANGYPDPNTTMIIVAEHPEDGVVGVWSAVTPVYLEGLWIEPKHRNTTVAGRLLSTMKGLLKEMRVSRAYTLVQSAEVLKLAEKAGFERVEGDLCALNLEEHG